MRCCIADAEKAWEGRAGSKHEGKRKTLKDEIAVVGSCT